MSVHSEVMVVTPDAAKQWLSENKKNFRKINKSRVSRYAGEMKKGEWHLNGTTVSFFEDGTLNDGQHRLSAVVSSGVAVPMIIVTGIKLADGKGVDRGGNRTVAQQLANANVPNANLVAAVSRWVAIHDSGSWSATGTGCNNFIDSDVFDIGIHYSNEINECSIHGTPMTASIATAVAFLASGKRGLSQSPLALWFFNALAKGEGLKKSDPVWAFREKLVQMKGASMKMSEFLVRTFLTVVWNQTANNELAKSIYRFTGPAAISPPNEVLIAPDLKGN